MMTLAEPPYRWDAETTTPPVLETLAAAVDPITGSMVKADVRRLEPWYGFKNGCVVSPRQVGSCAERVRSLMESGMSDERPLHELSRNDVEGTDREQEWWDLLGEACGVLKDAENLMRKWTSGPSPFVGKFPRQQLVRVRFFLYTRIDEVIDQLWYEFDYTEQQLDRQYHFFQLMLRMMWEGARDSDVDPVAAAVSRPRVAVMPNLSESPIERALLAALRRTGRLCLDPENVRSDCERVPDRCGIFIYQQATVLHYRADFLLGAMTAPDAAPHWVVVECDGHQFHERTAEQAEHDRARDRAMTAAGYRVFRFTGREIRRDATRCAAEVLSYLRPFARPQS